MKSIAKYCFFFIIFMCSLLIVTDMQSKTVREQEMEESLTLAMRNTLKATNVNKMYAITEDEMSAEFIRNIAQNINTDSEYNIYINESSTSGLLDVNIKQIFQHLNGQSGIIETRKTLILEDIPK